MSEQKQNSAEIDLYYFFKPLFTVFKKIGKGLDLAGRKIRRNIFAFAVIVILITAAGFSLRFILAPAYRTEGIFISNILPGKYCSLLLKNLNSLKDKKNKPVLAHQLKIGNEAAEDIQSISMSSMRDTFLIEKKDSTLSLFKITLVLKTMQNLDTIQSALVNYLENNEYALKRKEAKRKALQAMKANLNSKLESLDSLKKIVNSSIVPRSEGKGIILGEPIDPVSVYQAEINYYREQLSIDQALATIDNIEIIQPFLKINQTNYPRYNWMAGWFFIASLIIASLIVLLFGKSTKQPI